MWLSMNTISHSVVHSISLLHCVLSFLSFFLQKFVYSVSTPKLNHLRFDLFCVTDHLPLSSVTKFPCGVNHIHKYYTKQAVTN